jgi:AmmeMemoRadiSam system protein A
VLLAERGATFVTLTLDGALRGCIGSLNAHRVLARMCVRMPSQRRCATRASSGERGRIPRIEIEVSLLHEPEFMEFHDEADALAQLVPGQDGVIFFNGCQKATFLPQVWEQLPDRRSFMAALKQKARLPADFWGPNVMLARYRVRKWKENPKEADSMDAHPARYWHLLEDGRLQCDLCPRDCRLHEGQRGACFVRKMVEGKMVLTTYGRSSGFCIDPIEKSPSTISIRAAACCPSVPPAAIWPASSARTGTYPGAATWTVSWTRPRPPHRRGCRAPRLPERRLHLQ